MAEIPRYVVDASVATTWHLKDPLERHVALAEQVLRDFQEARIELLAPDHIRYEVGSAILNATRARPPRLSVADGALVGHLSREPPLLVALTGASSAGRTVGRKGQVRDR